MMFLSLPRNSPTFENFLRHSCLVFGIRRWQVIISLPQNFSCIGITEIHPIDFETFENIFGFWRHDLWFDFVPTIRFDNVILQKLISRFFSFLLVWVWLSHWHTNFSRTIGVSVQCWFSQVQVKIVISKQAFPPTFLWESLQSMFSFSLCFWVLIIFSISKHYQNLSTFLYCPFIWYFSDDIYWICKHWMKTSYAIILDFFQHKVIIEIIIENLLNYW